MLIDDTTAIAAMVALGGAITSMWVYYNKRIAAMEARIAKLEADRLDDYKAHLATANKLTERCITAIDKFSNAMQNLKNEIRET